MRTARSRLPKNFDLEQVLAENAAAVVSDPTKFKGSWNSLRHDLEDADTHPLAGSGHAFREVRLDLGCGKGIYAVECAKREPDVLFVGLDTDRVCVAYAARLAVTEGVDNAVFADAFELDLEETFAPGELSRIYLNFPTPFHRAGDAKKRLVYLDRILAYANIHAPNGKLRMRTDSQPLRDFALTQFELAGWNVTWTSDDVHSEYPDEPETDYERRAVNMGATVLGLEAVPPATNPEGVEQTAPKSLIAYLPDDLEHMGYVPFGMEVTVRKLIEERKRAAVRKRPR